MINLIIVLYSSGSKRLLRARYNYTAISDSDISFGCGEIIEFIHREYVAIDFVLIIIIDFFSHQHQTLSCFMSDRYQYFDYFHYDLVVFKIKCRL